ncbi:MAG: helix-turn-helix transcriptional regulator [Bacteroidales bacterium]|nr:helix-turn-helix transcriptional regulator [Bacteroidales bacterium]
MEKQKTMEHCSTKILAVRDALEIFSGKWKIPIIGALIYLGEAGFKDLQRMVGDITPKMLSKELKELEINLLVKRTVIDTRPVTVRYSITEYGKTCQSVIFELYQWGEKHRTRIKEGV